MSSSVRLYERLDQIPTDPEDEECLEDVVVCAFGAFERYYVCWKTRGGAYRQDGYDLPPDLEDFLFAKADKRDFASLQVVFGRGDEFFASDQNGKLEFKEPEPEKREPTPEELEGKRALRRSRTMSFMRPRSDDSSRHSFLDLESQSPASSRRSSLMNGRPPSLSLSFRSNSDASLHTLNSQPESRPPSASHTRLSSESSLSSQLWSRPSSVQSSNPPRLSSDSDLKTSEQTIDFEEERPIAPPAIPLGVQSTKRLRPLSLSFKGGLIPRIPEGKQVPQESPSPPSPLPPVPPMPQATTPIATPAKLWTARFASAPSSDPSSIRPLQLEQRTDDQAPSTRSTSPPFQLTEQTESHIPIEDSPPTLSLENISITTRTSPDRTPPPPLSLQISTSSVNTTPISPSAAPSLGAPPSPSALSIQIISTAAQTVPQSPTRVPTSKTVDPPPPLLSTHFAALSTTPISPFPPDLRLDTRIETAASLPAHTYSSSTASSTFDFATPHDDHQQAYFDPPPVFMGRMMEYYSKPGYQLGQSLFGGYHAREVLVEGEGEDGLTEWERANGVGY
ncbi:uncharacterized protein CC84DRAFT_1254722 [Paraphaeosphaeria sporulosa]|uniref:Uncharacterized protein n=1 Tax=Paraphaeosphaeria sporulosa TaxID=1460663 RepID=A0A177D031_9PLEO|nr:uncharacterized protein CC84DRAFT_1254722 [Paraphaeosphaeria sporulosa]OAG12470.1 hypothetical protein CC84DRAFT_1254722 [Paraphaeosphaeria sporulosa]